MRKEIQTLIDAYKAEYLRTNGKPVSVEYVHGWFKIPGLTNSRKAELEKMIATLKTRPTVVDRMEMVNGVSTLVKASQHVVQNLLSGKDVIEERDTPNCCSVASETYWSM
jgi:hypothetical protein